ncbi:MAG: glycosyltransferase [Patescibacteria group bacterium]
MRVAIIHDYLNQYGGAERVLESFCELFPDAPIYTLFYDEEKTLGRFKGKKIITSFLDHKYVINNHRLFIPLMPLAVSLMKVDDDYDVVLSSSAGFGKGIRYGKNTIHISYCHTPLRYAWEHYKYFNWPTYLKILSAPVFWYLRKWDKWVSQKPQKLIANSKHIAEKIKNYYKREAEVIYPPVDTEKFFIKKGVRKGDYFLAVGRLMHYKRFDLIIQAFNKLNLPLLIIGTGPELENLKKIVKSPKIDFLTSITDEQLVILYNGAQAFIFPQVEDFGLVAAEAQACGTPVIALNQGGGREIVENGKTGILFNNQNVDDLIMAVKRFQIKQFDQKLIRESALRFSKNKFKKEILKAVYEARNAR